MSVEIDRNNTKKDVPNQPKTLIFIKIRKHYKKDKKVDSYNKRTELNAMCSSKKNHRCYRDRKTNNIYKCNRVIMQEKSIVKKEKSKCGRTQSCKNHHQRILPTSISVRGYTIRNKNAIENMFR